MHDAVEAGILDLYLTKFWAIKFAAQAACTVLRVDQVGSQSTILYSFLMNLFAPVNIILSLSVGGVNLVTPRLKQTQLQCQ